MKWLPPPSEPRCVTLCAPRMAGCFSSSSFRPSARPLSANRRPTAFGTPSFQPPFRPMPPCGTAASMPLRSLARLSGRSLAVSVVRTAIMPQPMSTPTAAGTIAPRVAMTEPTVAPLPRCTSGMTATWLWMNGSAAILNSCRRAASSTGTPSIQALIGA